MNCTLVNFIGWKKGVGLVSCVIRHTLVLVPTLGILKLVFGSVREVPSGFVPLLLLVFKVSKDVTLAKLSTSSMVRKILIAKTTICNGRIMGRLGGSG